ncbi:MAG: hypothetical protein ACU0CA_08150, partial [Paracoccaceae bacterium]
LTGFSTIAFIVAFVLTPQLERSINQTMLLTDGELSALLDHPIAIGLLIASAFAIYFLGPWKKRGSLIK